MSDMPTGLLRGNLKERDHLEDLDVNGRITSLIKIAFESVDWIHEVQDRDKRWAVAKNFTKISSCTKCEEFLD
jgi:hypothetical protein